MRPENPVARRGLLAVAFLAATLPFAGSACDVPQPREPPREIDEPGPLSRASDLYGAGHTGQAMDLLREQIAGPAVSVAIWLWGLQLLGDGGRPSGAWPHGRRRSSGAADLEAVLAPIDPREAWLDFVVTDRGTVLLVLTRAGHRAALVPLDLAAPREAEARRRLGRAVRHR